jgi:zinc protease
MHKIGIVTAATILTVLFTSRTPAADPQPEKIVTIEGITEYQLANGVHVLLFPDPAASTVTVNLTVLVGSRHEGYGETGMAHLLEHMVFKGTPTFPDVPKALRDHGANFNGTTWVDRTNYFETMPATDENLEFGLHLEADRLINSFVKREDLLSEMTVVRNEFEAGENDPERILSQRMIAVAYEWHNYGKSTIGNRSDIERVPIENLQTFYKKHYQPDNVVLVVAGKFEEPKALALIGKYFASLKKPERKLDTTYTEEPAQDGERTVVLRRVGKVAVVGAVYHIPAGAHADFPAVDVLSGLLDNEPDGRLYKALVPTKKASRVSATAWGWHDPGWLEISAQAESPEKLDEVRDTLIKTLEKAGAEPFTEEEVERIKRKIIKAIELRFANSQRLAIELSEWAAKGDWRLFFLHRDQVAKVTPADVSRVAALYLRPSNRTVGLYIPTNEAARAEIPPTPSVAALVKDYKGKEALASGEAFDPTPANIEARTKFSQLPSGVKVAVLPRKTRGGMVNLQLTLRYGNADSLKGYTAAGELLPTLMGRGTSKHTRQQLQDEFDKLKVRFNANAGGTLLSQDAGLAIFSLECKSENLPAALTLLGEVLREPSFPAEEFEVLKRQNLEGLQKNQSEPTFQAITAIQRQLNPYDKNDVRYVPTIEEAIARANSLTLDQVRKLYTEQLSGQAGELVIVGECDPDKTPALVADLLKDWKSPTPFRRIPHELKESDGSRLVLDTPDKANAVFVAGEVIGLTDTDPDYPALQVGNFLFGQAPLASRLSNRVRGKEGLSYGVGSMAAASSQDKFGVFLMFAICNPAKIEQVDTTIAEELDKMLKTGVDEKELAEGKKAYLETLKTQRSNDAALAGQLTTALHAGRTFSYWEDLENKVAALKPEEVNTVFKKYIAPNKLHIIRAGDFKEKKGPPESK